MHNLLALSLILSSITAPGAKIIAAAIDQGADPIVAVRTLQCESNFQTDVYGDHGLAYGIAQFHEATFNAFKKEQGEPLLDYRNPDDQIALFARSIATGHGSSWTCFTKVTT